ncbi:MAG TPA: Stp1/IreP family PP2C-type Ser/Thr phosphatase [Solirubrobacteraceae bacterium]|jgi:protein phosphatase|nr:Stp1/IreP family PP2C-type Ser/Thr phosphatase [Solirubrobacteraceae bacterium]
MLRAADTIWKTDTGRQRRDNEDNAFVRAPLFVVADGMGGAQAGEVASKLAVEEFHEALPDEGSAEERLTNRIRAANRRIYDLSRTEHEHAGMGTTLTAAYLDDDHLAVAHVGDSRAYIFRDGELTRLTQDHSLVEELVRQGKLTEEQAAEHPQRSIITRALGIEGDVEVDTWSYSMRAGDVVLLCSDGLTSMIGEDRIAQILSGETSLDGVADQLIGAANEAGGRDNITVVLFRLEDTDPAHPAAAGDQSSAPTVVGMEPVVAPDERPEPDGNEVHAGRTEGGAVLTAPPPQLERQRERPTPRLARTQGPPTGSDARPRRRRPSRFMKPVAALIAVVIVVFVVGGGAYLASREYFFIGTNSDGIVTIFRGFPYNLPLGINMYEQFYVSGVPATAVPADRRAGLLNHQLRSQGNAISLVHAAELGQLAR